MRISISFFFLVWSVISYAQNVERINLNDVCPPPRKEYGNVDPVETFKDSLNVTIDIFTATLGNDKVNVAVKQSALITNETALYRLTENMGLSVSVGRVTENGLKFYVYKTHLFRRINGCWEDASWDNTWSKFNLGTVSGGYAFGNQGISSYIGFSGSIIIE